MCQFYGISFITSPYKVLSDKKSIITENLYDETVKMWVTSRIFQNDFCGGCDHPNPSLTPKEGGSTSTGVCGLFTGFALFSWKFTGPWEAIGSNFGRYQRNYQRCPGKFFKIQNLGEYKIILFGRVCILLYITCLYKLKKWHILVRYFSPLLIFKIQCNFWSASAKILF